MALTDLTRISTSGIATGSTIDSPTLRKDVDFRGDQVGITSVLFDSSEKELNLKDNVKLTFGDGNDLMLRHTGSAGYIENATGFLFIHGNDIALRSQAQKNYIVCDANAEVELYFNNDKKFETTNHGAIVTGILTATSFSGPVLGSPINNPSGISTFYDLRVTNNLTVEGSTTTLDTDLTAVDRVEVGADSNSVVGVAVTQSGSADIVKLVGSTDAVTIKSNGRIGIGTVTPLAGLHISDGTAYGTPQITNQKAQLVISAGTETSANIQLFANSYNHIFFGTSSDANAGSIVYTHTGGYTNNMTFGLGAGNVNLTHRGTFQIKSSMAAGNSFMQDFTIKDSNNNAQWQIGMYTNANEYLFINNNAEGNIVFAHASPNHVSFASDGRVGIGTNLLTPSFKLDVREAHATAYAANATSAQLAIGNINSSANTNFSGIHMYSDGNGRGVVNLNCLNNSASSSADFTIQTRHAGTLGERLRITSTGNITFGVQSSSTPVTSGTIKQISLGKDYWNGDKGHYNALRLLLYDVSENDVYGFGISNGELEIQSQGHIGIYAGGGSNSKRTRRMYIDNSGDVLFGFNTSSGVNSSSMFNMSLGGTFHDTNGYYPKLSLWHDGTDHMGFGVSSNQLDYILTSANYDHVFYGGNSGTTELLRIKGGTGGVGIGTVNPGSHTLQLYGASSSSFRISKSGVLAYDHTFDGSTYEIKNNNGSAGIPLIIGTKTAGGESLRITQSGKVGIGITNPSFSTINSVSGSNVLGIEIFQDVNDTATALKLAADNGSGNKAYSQLGYSGANATAHWANYNTSGTLQGQIIIGSTGKIGINNASPDGTLHVYSSSAGTVTADSKGDDLVLESSGNTGLSILSPGSGESTIFFGNPGTNGQKDAYIRYYHETHSTTANRRSLIFVTGGGDNERLRITDSGILEVSTTHASGYVAEFNQLSTSNSAQIKINSPTDSNSRPCLIDFARAGTVKWSAGMGYNDAYNGFHISAGSLSANTSNSKFVVTSDGYTGIGDYAGVGNDPVTSLLHVSTNWDNGGVPMVHFKGCNNEAPTNGNSGGNISFQITDENGNVLHKVWNTGGGNSDVGKVYYAGALGINDDSPTTKLNIKIGTSTEWDPNKNVSNTTNLDFLALDLINTDNDTNSEVGLMMEAGSSSAAQMTISTKKVSANYAELAIRTRDGGSASKEIWKIRGNGKRYVRTGATIDIEGGAQSASITPNNGDYVDFARVNYAGAAMGEIFIKWTSVTAPSCCHHGSAHLRIGTEYHTYFYGWNDWVDVISSAAHNSGWFSHWRLRRVVVSGVSYLYLQGKWDGANVSGGTFQVVIGKSAYHPNGGGLIEALTPVVDNNENGDTSGSKSYGDIQAQVQGKREADSPATTGDRITKSHSGRFHAYKGLSSHGEISAYNQPRMSAYKNAGQTYNSTPTIVTYGTETFDNGNDYDPSTGKFTCPMDGVYFVSYSANINSSSNWAYLECRVNGSAAFTHTRIMHYDFPRLTFAGSNYCNCAQGDEIAIYGWTNTGTVAGDNFGLFQVYMLS